VRRVVDDEVPGAVEVEAGPAAVRRVPTRLSASSFQRARASATATMMVTRRRRSGPVQRPSTRPEARP